LIQGAAGGVGLAAIQYAQSVGAEIFASAGSEEKRELLSRLGAHHVVDSRSLAFADDIREITDGEGVDVVLNSIAGEAIHKGLSILRAYGRFIELGKRDFFANSKIGLQPFRNNIQFFGVDVDRLLIDRPTLCGQLFAELAPLLDRRVFVPLPHRVFPITRAAEALRCMQHSRHIGKIVLAMDGSDRPRLVADEAETGLKLSPMASYLVTGGRSGFGLATAEWLVRKGARHLAVVGRSETTAPDSALALGRHPVLCGSVPFASCQLSDLLGLFRVACRRDRVLPRPDGRSDLNSKGAKGYELISHGAMLGGGSGA